MANKWLLPEESSRRKVIIILSRRQLKDLMSASEKDVKVEDFLFSNPHMSFIDLESIQEGYDSEVVRYLRNRNLLSLGSVLVQDPLCPDIGYVRLEDAQYNVAVNKYFQIAQLLLALGAEAVLIKKIELLDKKDEISVRADVEMNSEIVSLKKGTSKAELELQSRITKKLQHEFHLSFVDITLQRAYSEDEISKMLNNLRYIEEFDLLSRLAQNPPKSGRLKFMIKATSEIKRNMDIVSSVKFPELGGIAGKVKKAYEESFSFLLQIRVYFPGSNPKDDKEND